MTDITSGEEIRNVKLTKKTHDGLQSLFIIFIYYPGIGVIILDDKGFYYAFDSTWWPEKEKEKIMKGLNLFNLSGNLRVYVPDYYARIRFQKLNFPIPEYTPTLIIPVEGGVPCEGCGRNFRLFKKAIYILKKRLPTIQIQTSHPM